MTAEPLRVAIVESLPEVHLAVAGLLEHEADMCVVGHARSLAELVAADPLALDVLVADLRTCIGSPAALERLRERYPGLRLIVTMMNGGREYEKAIARLSPDAWLPKSDLGGRLTSTLRSLRPSGI
ncbi:MAG: hypothetical protein ACT4PY_10350 [Armatimonadota bacterium]